MKKKGKCTFIVDGKKVLANSGHTLFEINCLNGNIKKSDMAYENVVKIRERCVYVSALNINSAKRKFIKFILAGKNNKTI